ncbi:hypothetical protein Taro_028510 [Colocasia esculenta]|uniref:Uncharacterized protein n=1 Tax=Colocasia esculenta TaxID=4460 RepID=A0A843VQL1_COLES|nr:hypothetical protein [Colocasia esculenta]
MEKTTTTRKPKCNYFYQIWSIIEDGDLKITKPKKEWTDEERKNTSLNSKAKSILCCSSSKTEFNRISACKMAKEMWDKLKLTYEGTYKILMMTIWKMFLMIYM